MLRVALAVCFGAGSSTMYYIQLYILLLIKIIPPFSWTLCSTVMYLYGNLWAQWIEKFQKYIFLGKWITYIYNKCFLFHRWSYDPDQHWSFTLSLKFIYFENATKISQFYLTLLRMFKKSWKIFPNSCGLLRIYDSYPYNAIIAKWNCLFG